MMENHGTVRAIIQDDLKAHIIKVFETLNGAAELMNNWHIDAIIYYLMECYQGNIKRLIITLPPRHLKSLCTSIAFPTWVMGHKPDHQIICASYSDDLATSFSRDRRKVLVSASYKKTFPKIKIGPKDKNTEHEIATSQGGKCITSSVGGTLTGKGGNLIIIDDPIKTGESMTETERNAVNQWYRETVYTRLNDKKNDSIIIVMQRTHEDDLVGHVLDLDSWTVLNLPAIAQEDQRIPLGNDKFHEWFEGDLLHEEREDYDLIMSHKKVLGTSQFSAQYLQSPIPPGGNAIKRSWVKRLPKDFDRNRCDKIWQSWDTAAELTEGASYSVCTTWGIIEARAALLHVLRVQLLYPELRARVLKHARIWGAERVLMEKASSGLALLQDLIRSSHINLIPIKPRLSKLERAEQASAVIEAGRVFFPEEADWLATFEREIFSFPSCVHSDQVDSMTQFLLYWQHGGPRILNANVIGISSGRNTFYSRMGGSFPD